MIKITIDNTNYNIPSEWSDVTLAQYEKWFDSDIKTKENEIAFVSKVSNIPLDLLQTLPLSFYNDLVQIIGFALKDPNTLPRNNIKIGDVQYSINAEDELTLAEWVDVETVLGGSEDRLASVLAIVCRPTGEMYNTKNLPDRIELYKNMTMDKLYPLFAFFLTLKEQYQKIMNLSLMVQEATDQLHLHTEASLKNGLGITKLQNLRMMIYNKWTKFYKWVLLKSSTSFLTKLIRTEPKMNKESLKNN